MSIVIDSEALRYISLFETLTGANIKDCILVKEKIIFIVEEGHLKRALGRKKENVRKLKEIVKKGVDVIEYSTNIEQFVKNIFHNYNVKEVNVEVEGRRKKISVKVDSKDKGKAIGKMGKNLKLAREILKRHYSTARLIIL